MFLALSNFGTESPQLLYQLFGFLLHSPFIEMYGLLGSKLLL